MGSLDAMIRALRGFIDRFTPFKRWNYLRKILLASERWELAEASSDFGIYD
jgi:hypothetical protein